MTHGKRSTYVNHKCRCFACTLANARYSGPQKVKERRGEWEGLKPSKRAAWMLRKLRDEGFTDQEIAKRMGVSHFRVRETIRPETELRIKDLYDYYVIG